MRAALILAVLVVFLARMVCTQPLGCLCIQTPRHRHIPTPTRPTLVVITHDYEHVDLFCLTKLARRWRRRTGICSAFVVADLPHNKLFCRFVHDGNGDTHRCIYVRGGTTAAAREALYTSHVCLFLYRTATGTGVYHIAKGQDVLLVRITGPPPNCSHEHCPVRQTVLRTYGRRYRMEHAWFRGPRDDEPADAYMATVKARLYRDASAA